MTTPHLLIIEDYKDYRQALRHFLELNHVYADVTEACSGEEGVLLAKKIKPDIVVTDFDLGGINGLQVAREVKKHLPKCKIIMLTIYDPKEIQKKDSQKTVHFYISKSDLYEQLMPVINKILRSSSKNKRTTIKQRRGKI